MDRIELPSIYHQNDNVLYTASDIQKFEARGEKACTQAVPSNILGRDQGVSLRLYLFQRTQLYLAFTGDHESALRDRQIDA